MGLRERVFELLGDFEDEWVGEGAAERRIGFGFGRVGIGMRSGAEIGAAEAEWGLE